MIFGKIEFDIDLKHREKNCFAWLPVLLADGRLAWLEPVCKEKWTFDNFSGNNYYEPRIDLVVGEWRIQK